MRGGDLLHDAADIGAKLMPSTRQDDGRIPRPQKTLVAVDIQVDFPPENLKGLLLEPMKVIGVRLSRQLHQDLFAVVAIDAINQYASRAREVWNAIVVRIFDIELGTKLDARQY